VTALVRAKQSVANGSAVQVGGPDKLGAMAWISYGDANTGDNILRIHGLHPEVRRAHADLYVELMRKPGPLTRTQRERIAVVVSGVNHCHY